MQRCKYRSSSNNCIVIILIIVQLSVLGDKTYACEKVKIWTFIDALDWSRLCIFIPFSCLSGKDWAAVTLAYSLAWREARQDHLATSSQILLLHVALILLYILVQLTGRNPVTYHCKNMKQISSSMVKFKVVVTFEDKSTTIQKYVIAK